MAVDFQKCVTPPKDELVSLDGKENPKMDAMVSGVGAQSIIWAARSGQHQDQRDSRLPANYSQNSIWKAALSLWTQGSIPRPKPLWTSVQEHGAHYTLTVKDNQDTVHKQL